MNIYKYGLLLLAVLGLAACQKNPFRDSPLPGGRVHHPGLQKPFPIPAQSLGKDIIILHFHSFSLIIVQQNYSQ